MCILETILGFPRANINRARFTSCLRISFEMVHATVCLYSFIHLSLTHNKKKILRSILYSCIELRQWYNEVYFKMNTLETLWAR